MTNDNERVQTRASVYIRWMLLVPGCALPLLIAIWPRLSASELVGVAAGVATWVAVMIWIHVWRLTAGQYGETTRLSTAAQLFVLFQLVLGALAPPEAQFVFYSPAVILASQFSIPRLVAPGPVITYLLTLVCGLQALGCVLALSWGLERLRSHLDGPH